MAKSKPRMHPDAAAVVAAEERLDLAIAAVNNGMGSGRGEELLRELENARLALNAAQEKRLLSLPAAKPASTLDYCEPSDLDAYAEQIRALRMQALLDSDGGRDPFADEHFLLALDLLEQAMRHVRLASLHQARGLAHQR